MGRWCLRFFYNGDQKSLELYGAPQASDETGTIARHAATQLLKSVNTPDKPYFAWVEGGREVFSFALSDSEQTEQEGGDPID